MTFHGGGIDSLLHVAFVDTGEEATLVLDFEEELPGLLGDGNGKGLHII